MTMIPRKRGQLAWAFYDWANSAFVVAVVSGFFPVFFKQYWAASLDRSESTFWLGTVNSGASLLLVLLAPLLGALADHLGRRKGLLLLFALLGIVMTVGLGIAAEGAWQLAVLLYLLALVGFMGANVFYDALLMMVSPRGGREADRLSLLGFALGYLGGGLLFAFCVLLTQQPQWFGLAGAASAVRVSFLLVALWWAAFTLPLALRVDEPRRPAKSAGRALRAALGRVWLTLRELRALRQAVTFLAAYWLYIDGVDTVIRMAVDYGLSLGFEWKHLILALLIVQFIGFPATLLYGRIARNFGVRGGIVCGLAVYLGVTLWASLMRSQWEFFVLAVMIGLVQGGVQALSRSLFTRLIPPGQAAELFGFYNTVGKSAAVIGPIMMGWIGLLTGAPRLGILSLLLLFGAGIALLLLVEIPPDADDDDGR